VEAVEVELPLQTLVRQMDLGEVEVALSVEMVVAAQERYRLQALPTLAQVEEVAAGASQVLMLIAQVQQVQQAASSLHFQRAQRQSVALQ
jgi:hypothetical protein